MGPSLELLKELVSLDTSGGKNRDKAVALITRAAEEHGLRVKVVEVNGVPNLLVEGGGKGKRVIFVTHYDVVPPGEGWTRNPFEPVVEDGKLYGRGAADDKSAVVAVLDAMADASDYNVKPVLAIAGAEETGESEPFMKELEGDIGIVVDTSPVPSIGASGVLKWTVRVKGKQSHSGYPFLGKNALVDASKIVLFMERFGAFAERFLKSRYPGVEHYERLPVRATATVLHSGHAWNIIPGDAELALSIRTVPEWNNDIMEPLFTSMLRDFAKEEGIEIEITKDIDMRAWISEGEHVERFMKIYREVTGEDVRPAVELGGTDGVHLADRMPVIQFGPMRPENRIHGPDEFVYLKDFEMVYRVARRILEEGI